MGALKATLHWMMGTMDDVVMCLLLMHYSYNVSTTLNIFNDGYSPMYVKRYLGELFECSC